PSQQPLEGRSHWLARASAGLVRRVPRPARARRRTGPADRLPAGAGRSRPLRQRAHPPRPRRLRGRRDASPPRLLRRPRRAPLDAGCARAVTVVDEIFARFEESGDELYIGEPVTVSEHMLQAASFASRDEAPPELVAAALLHDYGHLVHDLPEDSAERGLDTRHEELGFAFLEQSFPVSVTEPIRLHVAAKRYLVAVEPAYRDELSPASRLSLA